MTLTNSAYIVCDLGTRTGVFEVSTDLEPETTVSHRYLIGNAGQRIGEAARFIGDVSNTDLGENEPRRRKGFTVDAGAGEWTGALTFSTGLDDVQWGDGSGGTGQANVTQYDAADVRSPDDEPNTVRGTVNYRRTDTVGLPDEIANAVESIGNAIEDAVGITPDA